MEELRKEITSYDEQLQTVEETIKQYETQLEEHNEKARETKVHCGFEHDQSTTNI